MHPACQTPSNETFNAPEPSDLQTYMKIPLSTTSMASWEFSSYPATSTGSTHATAATSDTTPVSTVNVVQSPPPPSSGLSTGAKAGIGVGVAVGALAVLGALMYVLAQRRRKTRNARPVEKKLDHEIDHETAIEPQYKPVAEMPDTTKRVELPLHPEQPQELEGAGTLGSTKTMGSKQNGNYAG
jgi:hypothetical protein